MIIFRKLLHSCVLTAYHNYASDDTDDAVADDLSDIYISTYLRRHNAWL